MNDVQKSAGDNKSSLATAIAKHERNLLFEAWTSAPQRSKSDAGAKPSTSVASEKETIPAPATSVDAQAPQVELVRAGIKQSDANRKSISAVPPATGADRTVVQTPAPSDRSVTPAASSDPFESSIPGRSEANKAAAIIADRTLSAEQKYKLSVPLFVASLRGASTINEQAVQTKLVSTQNQLESLTSDPTKEVDATARQNLEGQVAVLAQLRAEPFNAQLSFAAGLNSIAHQLTEQATKDPSNANLIKQNSGYLNNAAVAVLRDIGKNDPAYGGANASDTAVHKIVVDDAIANAQKGDLIDIQKSIDLFNQEVTRSFVASRIAQDGASLHSLTVGPAEASSALVVDYNLIRGVMKSTPLIGGLMNFAIPLLPSDSAVQNGLTGEFKAAKAADSNAADQAIQSHGHELKSEMLNGISTFFSGFGGIAAAEATIAGLAKVGIEMPNPYVKVASMAVLAVLDGVAINEAGQATAHATMGTTMDSQGTIFSESTASVASWGLLRNWPLGATVKTDAFKFGGALSTAGRATAIRAGVGFVPGASYALATHGPWNINSATNRHYTIGDTLEATAIDGGITAAAVAFAPYVPELAINSSRNLWRYKSVIGLSGLTNAVYQAGSDNPTQINRETGKSYTLIETAIHGAENFGTGAVGGLLVGKVLPAAAKWNAYLPNLLLLKPAKWAVNETAGFTATAAAEAAAAEAAEAEVATGATTMSKARAVVKPVEDGVNQIRRSLGYKKVELLQKIAGRGTFIGRTVAPQVTRMGAALTDAAPTATALATPATAAFLAPGAELYLWNKVDQESNK